LKRSSLRSRECCVFFFSSRRRHTIFSRDWSSDVCSSDLYTLHILRTFHSKQCSIKIIQHRKQLCYHSLSCSLDQLNTFSGSSFFVFIKLSKQTCKLIVSLIHLLLQLLFCTHFRFLFRILFYIFFLNIFLFVHVQPKFF